METTETNEGNSKTTKLFVAALIFALLAGLGTIIYLKVLERRLKERLTPPQKEMVQVIVASKDLPTGSIVNTSTMSIRQVPKAYVNSDSFTPNQFNSIQGAVLIKPLQHGKMLGQDYIDLKLPKDFSGTIHSGHRALTIQVDEVNSISGMIRPGNSIDLFTRMSAGNLPPANTDSSGDVVIPVIEDVLVLATDKISARPNEDEFKNLNSQERHRVYNTLTLEVTPREAALIAIAESRGEIIAVLRNSIDTGGILFSRVGIADLVNHSGAMLEAALNKQHNRNMDGIHLNDKGQLVTRDGVVIKDPNVHLDKNGLLVTKNGTVLSGRNLMVGDDGLIRTKNGKLVDTASLMNAKNGTLVDKDGTVLDSNGYTTAKGGFLIDKDGNIITHDGHILSGVTVGKDGKVRTKDGRVITADQISIGKDGKVRFTPDQPPAMTVDKDGNLRTADGKLINARDLVTVGKDGTVRAENGKILTGVTVGKDGKLYDGNGKEMSAKDVMLAADGFKENKDGTVTDAAGKVYTAKNLVTVDKDGTVRTKDGVILPGVHLDKNGNLRNTDGRLLTAADIIEQNEIAKAKAQAAAGKGIVLAGVSARQDTGFVASIGKKATEQLHEYIPYEVEYIVGGTSDGAAKTFKVQIENISRQPVQQH